MTYNVRFCKIAAVTPQKRQCELGSYYPAESSVKSPHRQAAGTFDEITTPSLQNTAHFTQ